jgi:hypothetical protein
MLINFGLPRGNHDDPVIRAAASLKAARRRASAWTGKT